MEEVILSGGEHGGEVVQRSLFLEIDGYFYFTNSDGCNYRLTDEIDANGYRQAVFCGK